jgi:hypothetical protein
MENGDEIVNNSHQTKLVFKNKRINADEKLQPTYNTT